MINICLASTYSGFILAYFNTINFDDTIKLFNIKQDMALMQGLLSFCIFIGAGVGGYLSSHMLSTFSRKYPSLIKIMHSIYSLCFNHCYPSSSNQNNLTDLHLSFGSRNICGNDISVSFNLYQRVCSNLNGWTNGLNKPTHAVYWSDLYFCADIHFVSIFIAWNILENSVRDSHFLFRSADF